tara:strand:+ start:70 stop:513 length:444 start_codon:yes stop_codon:yes gene_type:complete
MSRIDSSKDPFSSNNKHEGLFCCGRRGVNYLIINTSQFLFILTIIYFSYKCVTIGPDAMGVKDDQAKLAVFITIMILAFAILVYIWFLIIPGILLSYTITTSIEMMKDRELILKVISLQRMERSKRSHRIYQVLKLIRREMIIEFRK